MARYDIRLALYAATSTTTTHQKKIMIILAPLDSGRMSDPVDWQYISDDLVIYLPDTVLLNRCHFNFTPYQSTRRMISRRSMRKTWINELNKSKEFINKNARLCRHNSVFMSYWVHAIFPTLMKIFLLDQRLHVCEINALYNCHPNLKEEGSRL